MKWLDKTYTNFLPDDHPQQVRLRELNAKGSIKSFPALNPEYMRRQELGFYRNFNNIDDESPESWLARKTVCTSTAPDYMVALSCKSPNEDEYPLNSSGIVVKYEKTKHILTSTYIFGGRSKILNLEVDVFLPNGKTVCGSVSYADIENNIVLIHAELGDSSSATLATEFVDLGAQVLSLGLHPTYGLMVCRGTITGRKDDLVYDELMSSTCTISESGIGGPVIVQQSGVLIGINVYINKKSCLFIPSCILAHYLRYLVNIGRVLCPWLGFNARSLNEKKAVDLVALYKEFRSLKGIFVTWVEHGSPAYRAGICINDIIMSCNETDLSSPVELADLLLELGKSRLTRRSKRRPEVDEYEVEVVIQRSGIDKKLKKTIIFQDFTSPIVTKWPVVPLELSFNDGENLLYSSQVEYCEVEHFHQIVVNRSQEVGFIDGLGGMNCSSNLKTRNGLSSIFRDIEQTRCSRLPFGTDVIGNAHSTGIDSETSELVMLGEPVCSTSISDTLFGNVRTTSSGILQGDDPKADEIWNPEKFTCESLKKSMLLEVAGDILKARSFEKEEVTCKNEGLVDTRAAKNATSQHLFSLIHRDAAMNHHFPDNMGGPLLPY